jgi:hypothetical protein
MCFFLQSYSIIHKISLVSTLFLSVHLGGLLALKELSQIVEAIYLDFRQQDEVGLP